MESFGWYARLVGSVRSFADAVAVPKIVVGDVRATVARFLLDHTKFGDAVIVEWSMRQHLARAERLGAAVYCVYHGCDAEDCRDALEHVDD